MAVSLRVATRFALFAMAGELAIKAKILPWRKNHALKVSKVFYKQWIEKRGTGSTEHTKILESITDYIDKYGDTKFTWGNATPSVGGDVRGDQTRSTDRAGWIKTAKNCEDIFSHKKLGIDEYDLIYFFTASGFRAAIGDYDKDIAIKVLEDEGWLVVRGKKEAAKPLRFNGKQTRVYVIHPKIK